MICLKYEYKNICCRHTRLTKPCGHEMIYSLFETLSSKTKYASFSSWRDAIRCDTDWRGVTKQKNLIRQGNGMNNVSNLFTKLRKHYWKLNTE